ncbi:MAG: hypothetical protein ACREUA_09950 [Burkholderiales bacterium]
MVFPDFVQDLLNDPAVQGGVAPLAVGLILAMALIRVRLAGLAAVAGFLTAVYLMGSLSFWPLTAMRKIVLLAIVAPTLGVVADIAFKPSRTASALVAGFFALASVWVFWSVLVQRPLSDAILLGGGVAAFVFWVVATTALLQAQPLRVGSVGLALGLGAGVGAILGASAVLGLFGIALAAGTGGFLLVAMIFGKRIAGGATLVLTVSVISTLIGAGALVLANSPWWSLAVLALVPLAARLPVPEQRPAWIQAIVVSLYTLPVAATYCLLAWRFAE